MKQRFVLIPLTIIAVLGFASACDGMFTAEVIEEQVTVPVAGVSIFPRLVTVDAADSTNELEAEVVPHTATDQLIRWESNDESVALVDQAGVVTGAGLGTTRITATSGNGGYSDSVFVVVGNAIGAEGPAGGIIFYYDEAGDHEWSHLEAAPQGWDNGGADPVMAWSNMDDKRLGDTSEALGTGRVNTNLIIEQAGHTESAAKAAADFSPEKGGITYTDWFLPSTDEAYFLWRNLAREGLGGFSGVFYWTSFETTDINDTARLTDMANGARPDSFKSASYSVRPIRAF